MWKPLAEDKLTDMIEDAELFMSPGCRNLWDNIKINPQKWTQSPWGNDGGGFWVVAVLHVQAIDACRDFLIRQAIYLMGPQNRWPRGTATGTASPDIIRRRLRNALAKSSGIFQIAVPFDGTRWHEMLFHPFFESKGRTFESCWVHQF